MGRKQKQTSNKEVRHWRLQGIYCLFHVHYLQVDAGRAALPPSAYLSSLFLWSNPLNPFNEGLFKPSSDPLSGEGILFLPDHWWAETAPSMPALGRGAFYLRPTTQWKTQQGSFPPTCQCLFPQITVRGPTCEQGKEGEGVPSVVNIPVMFSVTEQA